MDILLIVFISLFVISSIFLMINYDEIANEVMKASVIGMIVVTICSIITYNQPTAIDVYRGKTILEITYRDSIPVDSVVVFKE